MNSLTFTGVSVAAMFVSALVGFVLQRSLPEAHITGPSRDIIGGVVGLLTLLLALVLGLLIWTAYGVTTTQKSELQTMVAKSLQFNLEMKQYGPEGDKARDLLRTDLVWAHEQFWGESEAQAAAYEASYKTMGQMNAALTDLRPATETQKQLLGAASRNYSFIGETRLLMSLQIIDPVSWPLLETVIAWSCLLFCGYGVLSRANATTLVVALLGAASVGSAIFVILELSQPYTSSMRLSPMSLEQVIIDLGS